MDLTGRVFGFLTVLHRAGAQSVSDNKHVYWLCRCICGQEIVARELVLSSGALKACMRNGHYWHSGHTRLPKRFPSEYKTWAAMRARCGLARYYKGAQRPGYENYGGRGIKVCPQWSSFEQFLADMGVKPDAARVTIERIDNNGDYTPENCRWATKAEQNRNKRWSVYVEYEGKRLLLVDLAARLGLDRRRIYQRLRSGWSLERALTIPVRRQKM